MDHNASIQALSVFRIFKNFKVIYLVEGIMDVYACEHIFGL